MKQQESPDVLQALQTFADKNGRNWKSKLINIWVNGNDQKHSDGGLLRRARNELGPSWLLSKKNIIKPLVA